MNKKILFFMVSLQSGGGERVMVDLMNNFVENGNQITLVLMKKEGVYLSQLSSLVEIKDINKKKFFSAFFCLIKIIKKTKPDIVFSSSIHTNIVLLFAAFFSKIKVKKVIRVGVPLSLVFKRFSSFKDRVLIPFFTTFFYKRADAIIAVSNGIADDIVSTTKTPKDLVRVIYNPKDRKAILKKADEYVPNVFKKQLGPFIVFVGRLVKEKNLPLLIEAFSLLIRKTSAHLILVGDGGEKENLKKIIKKYELAPYVSIEGNQENSLAYIKNSDVIVLPSLSEGLPNVLIEALFLKTLIVATDCPAGGVREIIAPNTNYKKRVKFQIEKNDSGILVPVNNKYLLSEALALSVIEKKSVNYTPNIERFFMDNVIKEYEKVFLN